jgi:hypothetical protein
MFLIIISNQKKKKIGETMQNNYKNLTKSQISKYQSIYHMLTDIAFIHKDNPRGSSNEFMYSTSKMIEKIEQLEKKLKSIFPSYEFSQSNYFHIPFILSFDNLCEIKPLYDYINHFHPIKLLKIKIIPHSIDYIFTGKLIVSIINFPMTLDKDIYKNTTYHEIHNPYKSNQLKGEKNEI